MEKITLRDVEKLYADSFFWNLKGRGMITQKEAAQILHLLCPNVKLSKEVQKLLEE